MSLRKKKTHDLISAKRRKLMAPGGGADEAAGESVTGATAAAADLPNTMYKGHLLFE